MRSIAGRPLIGWHLARILRAQKINEFVLATSSNASDNDLADYAQSFGVKVVRGPEHDVLGRFLKAIEPSAANLVVRVTGDCPLIDPFLADAVISFFLDNNKLDYAALDVIKCYPRGLDVEVMRYEALIEAGANASSPYEREHVTPYIYNNNELFRTAVFAQPHSFSKAATWRWCVDEEADLELVERILLHFAPSGDGFGWRDVAALLAEEPEWTNLNKNVTQRYGHAELADNDTFKE